MKAYQKNDGNVPNFGGDVCLDVVLKDGTCIYAKKFRRLDFNIDCTGSDIEYWRVAVEEAADRPDIVNHPPDYVAHPSGIQTIQIAGRENIFLRTAIDYLWRGGLKADRIEDLKKARWYIDREIERLEKSE